MSNSVDGGEHREICPSFVLVALRTLSVLRARFAKRVVVCEIVVCIVYAAATSPTSTHRATSH